MNTDAMNDRKICIVATNGFEQSELFVPLEKLRKAGAEVHIVSPEEDEIRGWDMDDWGDSIAVDRPLDQVSADDYDALVLPGGQINPDLLRVNDDVIALIRAFNDDGKPIAAICHAPWLLIEAGLVRGKTLTSYPSIRTDMLNAGAIIEDQSVVIDGNLITSRNPDDLDDFVAALVDALTDEARAAA